MNHEESSYFSIGTRSSGCVFSDGRSVCSNLRCDDVDLSVDHERPVHELHHLSVLLLSVPVPAGNVLLSGSDVLCGHQVL
jgi:hypothetical protein